MGAQAAAMPAAPQAPPLTPQQQYILESFNSVVYVANRMDIQDEPIYDSVTIAAGANLTTIASVLFTNVGPQSGKTLALTNMTQPQKLNAPEAFAVFGYSFRWAENISLLDLYNIMNGFCFQFILGSKPYQTGPLWVYNAGGGIYGTLTNTQTSVLNNGMPGRSEMHRLGINVVLENQMSFYGQLQGNQYTLNAAGSGIFYQMVLRGLHARGVQ